MKKYRVAVAYETGFIVEVEAGDSRLAGELVMEMIDEDDIPEGAKVLHRDYFITDVEYD
jgi:hypothetical protein